MPDETAGAWVDLSQPHGLFDPEFARERDWRLSLEGDALAREIAARLAHARETRQKVVELIGFRITEVPRELSAFHWLETLNLGATAVTDLGPLTQLNNLTALNLWGTGVSDLSLLVGLKHLTRLDVGSTRVNDLGPLVKLNCLTALDLSDTSVSDLAPLRELKNLRQLIVGAPCVGDLDPLSVWK